MDMESSEHTLDKYWDRCVEGLLLRTVTGLLSAGIASIVLFKSPAARGYFTGLGSGIGAMYAWNKDCKLPKKNYFQ